jgi:hypothetical protein
METNLESFKKCDNGPGLFFYFILSYIFLFLFSLSAHENDEYDNRLKRKIDK